MRYTYSSNFGCLILILVMFFLFSFVGVLSRLVFTTPLGIILLVSAGVWYVMKSREISNKSDTTFSEQQTEQTYKWDSASEESASGAHQENELTRDAEDVDFTEIDE